MTSRRPPLLIALQTEATILMSISIGQAGLAAGFLSGTRSLKSVHEVLGFVIGALTVITLVTAVVYARGGGPRWPAVATTVVTVAVLVQIALGESEVKGLHIFLGVLVVTMTALLTSYLFRPGFGPRTDGH